MPAQRRQDTIRHVYVHQNIGIVRYKGLPLRGRNRDNVFITWVLQQPVIVFLRLFAAPVDAALLLLLGRALPLYNSAHLRFETGADLETPGLRGRDLQALLASIADGSRTTYLGEVGFIFL